MNAVAMANQLFVTNSATGALVEASAMPTTDFAQILGGMKLSNLTKGETEKTPMEQMLDSIISMVQNGATEEEMAKALSGMSKEDIDSLLQIIEQVIAEISKAFQNGENEILQETQIDDKDNTTIPKEIVDQILTAMGITPTSVNGISSENFNLNFDVSTLKISSTTPQNLSDVADMLKTLQNSLQKVQASSQQKFEEHITVIKNDFANATKTVEVEHTQDFTAQKTGVKSAEKTSEFDELLAFAQQSKVQTEQVEKTQTILPVQKQITNQIEQMLSTKMMDNSKELTIMLKPVELGEINIKLVQSDKGVIVSIMAVNSETQKLISQQLPSLVSSLQNINSEVKNVTIVNPNENASAFLGDFNLSQSNSQSQQNHQQSHQSYFVDTTAEQSENQEILIREGKLWQTA